ncbi:hypothetical protein MSM1_21085 [Mycobacterium sp. SM1]|uniref:hypothetical protein n=1 Tax=Mycobacterium sp. SM1 TaxID=2816243 RepID=UPI001BD01C51|nr:hypothetical protein [Mycobacterium sp. SM1]MBS4730698.1 hypothetical protein [Mycobacterium sp. SM1]
MGALVERLQLMFEWYKGMADPSTGRLLYLYDAENDVAISDGEPIRDIAAVWDVEVLSAFLGRDELRDVIRGSLEHFGRLVIRQEGYAMVAPQGEPSSIAHSAFLILALAWSDLPDKVQRLTPLAEGILRQQRQDGSYQVFFGALPDRGEELYPAEAMLALLEAHRLTGEIRYLDSAERGFDHYKRDYYERGRLDPDVLVFFANWQSQAGRALFAATSRLKVKDLVRGFVFELHDRIIASGFYDCVARSPERQAVVEVACALEGLADAYAIAVAGRDQRTANYRRCIKTALGFLARAQRATHCTDRERGGFASTLGGREQRIDVTGHVASGFIKCVEHGIAEPG